MIDSVYGIVSIISFSCIIGISLVCMNRVLKK